MFPIQSTPLTPIAPALPQPATPEQQTGFGDIFSSLLNGTMNAEANAQNLIETSLIGGDVTQAEVMSSVKKAEISVRMLMQVRNKVLDAINEIQQMRF